MQPALCMTGTKPLPANDSHQQDLETEAYLILGMVLL